MKKILLVALMFVLFAGIATASSINGDYEGHPIVLIKSNGKQLETDEVPGFIYNGHTMVPISTLRQLGASVTWDQDTYSVNVSFSSVTDSTYGSDEDKLKNQNEYLYLSKLTEVLRGIYSFEEQFGLLTLISTGIAPNVSSRDDFETLSHALDRVNIDILRDWVRHFNDMGLNQEDISKFDEVVNSLELAKESLSKLDSTTATVTINNAKGKFNLVANKYDGIARDAIKLK